MQNSNRKKEDTVYCGQYLEFCKCEDGIGKGGNGTVYPIVLTKGEDWILQNWPDFHGGEFVVKVFSVENKKTEVREKRYTRFCREIKKQLDLSKKIKGVMPVIDYYLPEKYDDWDVAWYVMPRAKSINHIYRQSIEEKLAFLESLLNIIEQTHQQGVAHRDIKPDNLLILNDRLYLSDFGLLWEKDSEHITNEGERLGPIKILPPEMEHAGNIRGFNYFESDIYLYAKVMWIILKANNSGFYGPYSRSASQVYLDKKRFGCSTLEPIHCLLEGATLDLWKERISIDTCRKLLLEQLYVCKGQLPEEDENRYMQQEAAKRFLVTVTSDENIYRDLEKVHKYLNDVVKGHEVFFGIEPEVYYIRPDLIKRVGNDFLFIEKTAWGKLKKYLISIDRIAVSGETSTIYTKEIIDDQKDFVRLSLLEPVRYPLELNIAIDRRVEIKIKP